MSKPLSFFLLEEDRFRDLDRKFTGCTRRKSVRKEEIQPFIHIHMGCSKAVPGCYCCFAEFFQSRASSAPALSTQPLTWALLKHTVLGRVGRFCVMSSSTISRARDFRTFLMGLLRSWGM